MTFRAGQTFLFPLNDHAIEHLWIVATNPNTDGLVAVVNLTSLKGAKDQTVVFRKGEHPFIKWDTSVNYALADLVQVSKLEQYVNSGRAKLREDLPSNLVALLLDGFTASDFTKNRVVAFIRLYKAGLS